jgi:cytochrome c553
MHLPPGRWIWIAIALTVACGTGDEPPAPTSGSPTTQRETGPRPRAPSGDMRPSGDLKPGSERAQALFTSMCATCHGIDGRGDGPAAASLDPRPRDYSDPAWQASVTDDYLKKLIVEGGKKNGKSPLMPGNPDLASKPDVLDGLVHIIRGFKTASPDPAAPQLQK